MRHRSFYFSITMVKREPSLTAMCSFTCFMLITGYRSCGDIWPLISYNKRNISTIPNSGGKCHISSHAEKVTCTIYAVTIHYVNPLTVY